MRIDTERLQSFLDQFRLIKEKHDEVARANGERFKDTSGPSMNILINVMAIVSLVIAPLLGV